MTDKTKNYLGWAIIGGIVIFAVAALWYVSAYARSIEPSAYRSFSVSGEGKVITVPDIARFTFSVVNEGGKDIAALQQDNTKKVNAIIDFLKSKKVASKDISTEQYNLEPRYQTSNCGWRANGSEPAICPPPTIVGYTVTQTVAVKVRDLTKVGDVLAGVVAQGANTVSQLTFTIDDPAKAEAEARGRAIKQAQEKAQAMAQAGDFRVGRLLSIEDGNYYPERLYKSAAFGIGGADTSESVPVPTIEPGSQEVQITVIARYEIE